MHKVGMGRTTSTPCVNRGARAGEGECKVMGWGAAPGVKGRMQGLEALSPGMEGLIQGLKALSLGLGGLIQGLGCLSRGMEGLS